MKPWWLLLVPALASAAPVWVGRFPESGAIPAPWQVEHLNKDFAPTRYGLRHWDGVPAVEAHAVKSMALLARPVEIDLAKTPILCWRWRVDAPLKAADLATKSGDDYAARVYLSRHEAAAAFAPASRSAEERGVAQQGNPLRAAEGEPCA